MIRDFSEIFLYNDLRFILRGHYDYIRTDSRTFGGSYQRKRSDADRNRAQARRYASDRCAISRRADVARTGHICKSLQNTGCRRKLHSMVPRVSLSSTGMPLSCNRFAKAAPSSRRQSNSAVSRYVGGNMRRSSHAAGERRSARRAAKTLRISRSSYRSDIFSA